LTAARERRCCDDRRDKNVEHRAHGDLIAQFNRMRD
jgi:hypothetical protein